MDADNQIVAVDVKQIALMHAPMDAHHAIQVVQVAAKDAAVVVAHLVQVDVHKVAQNRAEEQIAKRLHVMAMVVHLTVQ